jgi:hypothetical protein
MLAVPLLLAGLAVYVGELSGPFSSPPPAGPPAG